MNELGKLILRVGLSALMIPHGWEKLNRVIAGDLGFVDPLKIGERPSLFLTIIAELVCPGLIILGFKTRFAAVPVVATMLVATFMVHVDDPWSKKEFALIYAVGFFSLIFLGSGKYSFDKK